MAFPIRFPTNPTLPGATAARRRHRADRPLGPGMLY